MNKLMWRNISTGKQQVFFEEDAMYTVQFLPLNACWRAYFEGCVLPGIHNFNSREGAVAACQEHYDANK